MENLLTKLMTVSGTVWWSYLLKPLLLGMFVIVIYAKGYTDAAQHHRTSQLEKAWRLFEKAEALRADQYRHDAHPDGLRQDDGFRRD